MDDPIHCTHTYIKQPHKLQLHPTVLWSSVTINSPCIDTKSDMENSEVWLTLLQQDSHYYIPSDASVL